MEPQLPGSSTTYSVLHSLPDDHLGGDTGIGEPLSPIPEGDVEQAADDPDDDDDDDHSHHHKHKHVHKEQYESFDFNDTETMMWKKHQLRRYFQGKGKFWTASRITTFWKWFLVIVTGVLIAFIGGFVAVFTEALMEWKFESCHKLTEEGDFAAAFFAYHFISLFLVMIAGALCWWQPLAAGSGIPEIKAFLNGVNIPNIVNLRILFAKVVGMCFSVSAGLPMGKEGPMIHAGSIIGAVVSQGNTISFGFDTSWNIFQDLRNDYTKRDYITYGAAAGVAAAFRSPLGGILFTLEEGASFWSTITTFRSFMCAVVTQLTISLLFPDAATSSANMFALGQFDNLFDGRSNYYVYELPLFMAMGAAGGVLGAFFNHLNMKVSQYRAKHINHDKMKRYIELCSITLLMCFISFILSICWQACTPVPEPNEDTTRQEEDLLERLVQFQCPHGHYNQLASLYFTSGETAMRQMFHFREVNGEGNHSFTSGPLILFFIPYFLMAAITSGVMAPAGLFVPTLCAGAAFGRLIGHWMNLSFPGHVADSGTYALIGAASILGGMARMTIAGCVICLEACGNISYLLPLMVTFAASRYSGNAINHPMYDMQIILKKMPFLEGSLHSLGLLNYLSITRFMTTNVITLNEVEKVSRVLEVLKNSSHNGFPVVNREGKLRGLILRKSLITLLKLKAYCTPAADVAVHADGGIVLAQAATVFYDTIERAYPNYPDTKSIKLSEKEMNFWLDMRSHMDCSPITVNENCTLRRCYNLFRTMGLRHLVVVDGELHVAGIITRTDLNEHVLEHLWKEEGETMIKEMSVDTLPPAIGYEPKYEERMYRRRSASVQSNNTVDTVESDVDIEILMNDLEISDSPNIIIRKRLVP